MIERCETLIITILSCVVLLRRQFVFHWHLYKPVEPVLNGQPVLRGYPGENHAKGATAYITDLPQTFYVGLTW